MTSMPHRDALLTEILAIHAQLDPRRQAILESYAVQLVTEQQAEADL